MRNPLLTRLAVIAALTVFTAGPLSSQRLTQRAGVSEPASGTAAMRPMWVNSRRDVTPNNWAKGALIGGGIGLAVGAILMQLVPYDNDSHFATRFVLGTTFFGAVTGAFIGSGSKKK